MSELKKLLDKFKYDGNYETRVATEEHIVNMFAAKGAEIERLQKEIKQILTLGVEMQREVNRKLSLQLDDLKSELVEKNSVLEFYGKDYFYQACSHGGTPSIMEDDFGKRAREVMAKYKREA